MNQQIDESIPRKVLQRVSPMEPLSCIFNSETMEMWHNQIFMQIDNRIQEVWNILHIQKICCWLENSTYTRERNDCIWFTHVIIFDFWQSVDVFIHQHLYELDLTFTDLHMLIAQFINRLDISNVSQANRIRFFNLWITFSAILKMLAF